MTKKFLLSILFFATYISYSQVNIELPSNVDINGYDILNIEAEGENFIITWFKQEDVLVMGKSETESMGNVIKVMPNAKNNSTKFILGGRIFGSNGNDLTVPFARGAYFVIKQLIDANGKNIELKSITPIAFRHFEKDSVYYIHFPQGKKLGGQSTIKASFNLTNLNTNKTISPKEHDIILNNFIDSYDAIDAKKPEKINAYDALRSDFISLSEAFSFPKIPEGQKFNKMIRVGKKTILITRDRRYKNEGGSQFNFYDASDYSNLVLIDSNYTADEASLDQYVLVHKPNGTLAGIMFSYTLEKMLKKQDNEYGRMLVYIDLNNNVNKTLFKNGTSKGLFNYYMYYAINFGDSIVIQNSHAEKQLKIFETWSLKKTNEIIKRTSADSNAVFRKNKMVNLGSGYEVVSFASGDTKFRITDIYNTKSSSIVICQAKDILQTCETCAPDPEKNNFSLPTISVLEGSKLLGVCRLNFPYNSSKPINTQLAFSNDNFSIILFDYQSNPQLLRISNEGGFNLIPIDKNDGFLPYRMLNGNMFINKNNALFLIKRDLQNRFKIEKIN